MNERRYDPAQEVPPPFAAWTWSLNWDEITPFILVGSCPMDPEHIDRIRLGGRASALLSVQHDACLAQFGIDYAAHVGHARASDLEMVRHPIRDFDADEMRARLPGAVRALAALLDAGHRVYVHCTAGMGRSPLTVMAYLALIEGWAPDAAIAFLHRRRSCISPDWENFFACRRDLAERQRYRIERRAWALHESGRYGDPHADWCHAEAEILRTAVLES